MLALERRLRIAELLAEKGSVEIAELAALFGVATETIRRDLKQLEEEGILRRTHGGATSIDRHRISPLPERVTQKQAEKERIARAAIALLSPGERIILDGGSTTLQIARLLKNWRQGRLVVVTGALNIALELAGLPQVMVNVPGGILHEASLSLIGPEAVRAYARYQVDTAFMATSGLTLEHGLGISNGFEAEVKTAMLQVARRVVVVADHSKLGRTGLVAYAPVTAVQTLITDKAAPPEIVTALRERGVEVVLA